MTEEIGYCQDLQCYNAVPCAIHQAATCCEEAKFEGYTVYYWPGFSGRGQPLMAMLAEAEVKWQRKPEPCKEADCFACPMVRKGNFCLAQTTALAQYLGEELGFNHPPALRHVAAKLGADLGDLWSDVYGKRCSAANWSEVDEYCKDRVADWFATLENAAAKYGSNGFFLGDRMSYVDFLLWNVIEVIHFCYGTVRLARLLAIAPRLQAIHAYVAARPRVAAYAKEEPVLYPGARDDAAIPVKD